MYKVQGYHGSIHNQEHSSLTIATPPAYQYRAYSIPIHGLLHNVVHNKMLTWRKAVPVATSKSTNYYSNCKKYTVCGYSIKSITLVFLFFCLLYSVWLQYADSAIQLGGCIIIILYSWH